MAKDKSYSEKLKDPRWQKKRLKILERDNFTCRLCYDYESSLHIHHKIYLNNKEPWEIEDINLITLCEHCHKNMEVISRDVKLNFNELSCKRITWKNEDVFYVYSYQNTVILSIVRNKILLNVYCFKDKKFLDLFNQVNKAYLYGGMD